MPEYALFTASDGVRSMQLSLVQHDQGVWRGVADTGSAAVASGGNSERSIRYFLRLAYTYHKHAKTVLDCLDSLGSAPSAGRPLGMDVAAFLIRPGRVHHIAFAHEWKEKGALSLLSRGLAGAGFMPTPGEATPVCVILDGHLVCDSLARYPNLQPTARITSGNNTAWAQPQDGAPTSIPAISHVLGCDFLLRNKRSGEVLSSFRGYMRQVGFFAACMPIALLVQLHAIPAQFDWPLPILPVQRQESGRTGSADEQAALELAQMWLVYSVPCAVVPPGPTRHRPTTPSGWQVQQSESVVHSSRMGEALLRIGLLAGRHRVQFLCDSVSQARLVRSGTLEEVTDGNGVSQNPAVASDENDDLPDLVPVAQIVESAVGSDNSGLVGLYQGSSAHAGPCCVLTVYRAGDARAPVDVHVAMGASHDALRAWNAFRTHSNVGGQFDALGAALDQRPPPHWMASYWAMQSSGEREKLLPPQLHAGMAQVLTNTAVSFDGGASCQETSGVEVNESTVQNSADIRCTALEETPSVEASPPSVLLAESRGLAAIFRPASHSEPSVLLSPLEARSVPGLVSDASLASFSVASDSFTPLHSQTQGTGAEGVCRRDRTESAFMDEPRARLSALDDVYVSPAPFPSLAFAGRRPHADSVAAAQHPKPNAGSLFQCEASVVQPLRRTAAKFLLFSGYIVIEPDDGSLVPDESGSSSAEVVQQAAGAVPSPWSSRKAYLSSLLPAAVKLVLPLSSLLSIERRWHQLRSTALEIFYTSASEVQSGCRPSVLVAFQTPAARTVAIRALLKLRPPNMAPFLASTESVREAAEVLAARWRTGCVSNLEYLLSLNRLAGRTIHDLSQYPLMPWVLKEYQSASIDLADSGVYRDLAWPIGAQTEERRKALHQKYEFLQQEFDESRSSGGSVRADATEADKQSVQPAARLMEGHDLFVGSPFHFGSNVMKPGTVAWYLLRLEPYTSYHVVTSDGRFDRADRLFYSVAEAFAGSITSDSDVRELVPEAYLSTDGGWLLNRNRLCLGRRHDGDMVGDVVLPPWAENSPARFTRIMRAALESAHVSSALHLWVDLVFGRKSGPGLPFPSAARGQADLPLAVRSLNTYHGLMYHRFIDTEALWEAVQEENRAGVGDRRADDNGGKALLLLRVNAFRDEFGVMPLVLFADPPRLPVAKSISGVRDTASTIPPSPGLRRASSVRSGAVLDSPSRALPVRLVPATSPQRLTRPSRLAGHADSPSLAPQRPVYATGGPGSRAVRFGGVRSREGSDSSSSLPGLSLPMTSAGASPDNDEPTSGTNPSSTDAAALDGGMSASAAARHALLSFHLRFPGSSSCGSCESAHAAGGSFQSAQGLPSPWSSVLRCLEQHPLGETWLVLPSVPVRFTIDPSSQRSLIVTLAPGSTWASTVSVYLSGSTLGFGVRREQTADSKDARRLLAPAATLHVPGTGRITALGACPIPHPAVGCGAASLTAPERLSAAASRGDVLAVGDAAGVLHFFSVGVARPQHGVADARVVEVVVKALARASCGRSHDGNGHTPISVRRLAVHSDGSVGVQVRGARAGVDT